MTRVKMYKRFMLKYCMERAGENYVICVEKHSGGNVERSKCAVNADGETARAMLEKLCRNGVTPLTLADVIEDYSLLELVIERSVFFCPTGV